MQHKSAHTAMDASQDAPDLPSNSAISRTRTATPTSSAAFMKKKLSMKKKIRSTTRTACRNGRYRHGDYPRRLEKFCKRRNGLFKAARELSSLCNAEVAAIIVSPHGKVSEFASSSMSHVLKRYESFQPQMRSNNVLLHDVKKWKHEAVLLRSKFKVLKDLKRFSKNVPSSINAVENFESILANTLDVIRRKKMELLEVEIQKLVQQGEVLLNENLVLEEKLTEILSTKECISNAIGGSEEFCYE